MRRLHIAHLVLLYSVRCVSAAHVADFIRETIKFIMSVDSNKHQQYGVAGVIWRFRCEMSRLSIPPEGPKVVVATLVRNSAWHVAPGCR